MEFIGYLRYLVAVHGSYSLYTKEGINITVLFTCSHCSKWLIHFNVSSFLFPYLK